MDEESVRETISTMALIIGELAEIPLENFIKQLNYMLKNDKFSDDYPREIMVQFNMLAHGLLSLKINLLMGFSAFDDFNLVNKK